MKKLIIMVLTLAVGHSTFAQKPVNFPDLAAEGSCPTLNIPRGVNPSVFFNSNCTTAFILPNINGRVTYKRPLVSQALTPQFCGIVAETSQDFSANKKATRQLREIVAELSRKKLDASPEDLAKYDASITSTTAQIRELDRLMAEDVASISKIDGLVVNARYDLRWEEDINRIAEANRTTVSGVSFRPAFVQDGMLSVGSASGTSARKTKNAGEEGTVLEQEEEKYSLPLINRVVAPGERIVRSTDSEVIHIKAKGSTEISVSLSPAGACKVFEDPNTRRYIIDSQNVEAGSFASAVAVGYIYTVPMLTRWKYQALANHKNMLDLIKRHILEKGKYESSYFGLERTDGKVHAGSVNRNDIYNHVLAANKQDAFYFQWDQAPGAKIPSLEGLGQKSTLYQDVAMAIKDDVQNRIFDKAMTDLVDLNVIGAKLNGKEIDPVTHTKAVFVSRSCSDVRDSFGIIKYGENCHDNYRNIEYYYAGKSSTQEKYEFNITGASREVVEIGQPVNVFYTSTFTDARLEL